MAESIYRAQIWKETGTDHTLGKRVFIFMLSFWTVFGIMVSSWASGISAHWQIGTLGFLGLFAASMVGVVLSATGKDNILLSLLGYVIMSGALGLLLGPVLAMYTVASVIKIMGCTVGVVVGLGAVGVIYPGSLESWGAYLTGALWILLVGLIGVPIAIHFGAPIKGLLTWMDWVGLLIFGGLVIYDLNRAMRVERTHTNAVGCAVGIYLDFMNIFIRLLSLFGVKRTNDTRDNRILDLPFPKRATNLYKV